MSIDFGTQKKKKKIVSLQGPINVLKPVNKLISYTVKADSIGYRNNF